jgi:hypothetical protein
MDSDCKDGCSKLQMKVSSFQFTEEQMRLLSLKEIEQLVIKHLNCQM